MFIRDSLDTEHVVLCVETIRWGTARLIESRGFHLPGQGGDDGGRELVLHHENVFELSIEAMRPTCGLGVCIEKQKAFCCYNTPLARIINEQAYPQLGRSWGEAKSSDCRGLSLPELQRLDWSRIDLSEWLALLSQAGQLPTPDALDIERLTGAGSTLNTGARANAAARTEARAEGLDGNAVAREAEEVVWEEVLRGLP
mgnify:CR=1 FL=1